MLTTVFLLLIVYQLKHFVADYPLQTSYMLGKFKPGWGYLKPLLAHVAVHGFGTLLIAAAFGATARLALGLAVFDATIHFIMDRIKAAPHIMGRWKMLSGKEMMSILSYRDTIGLDKYSAELRGNRLFWWALGFDQMVHHLTHYAIIYVLVTR